MIIKEYVGGETYNCEQKRKYNACQEKAEVRMTTKITDVKIWRILPFGPCVK